MCGNVCIYVSVCVSCVPPPLGLLFVCLLCSILVCLFVVFPTCLCSNEREKKRMWILVGGKVRETGRNWRGEICDQNIL